jgi:RNA polymerase sigma-70 factor (ECF subfamily)
LPNSTPHNEKELLVKISQGDEAAFTQLFYAYHNRLGAYVYRLTRSPEVTEEIVQDVFMKIWSNRGALYEVEKFGSYIYVLSRNQTFNQLRRIAREHIRRKKALENMDGFYQPVDLSEQSDDYFSLLEEAVEELPPQQQRVYLLSKRERMTYQEIALQLHISKETVKKHLSLASKFIINYLRSHRDLLILCLLISL